MENLVNFNGVRIFVTGHTGFKGSWMMAMLEELGAETGGLSLGNDEFLHFSALRPKVTSFWGDVRDRGFVNRAVREFKPDLIIHMAAQALVGVAHRDPVGTFETNVTGTLHVLEAARLHGAIPVLNVTSDKCYLETSDRRAHVEADPLGGHESYGASKAAAELLTAAYRASYLPHTATARAGNVLGGGDWAQQRLVPDMVRAWQARSVLALRNPSAVRPWQHVLDVIYGYLQLAEKLLKRDLRFAGPWNFGPAPSNERSVQAIVDFGLENFFPILNIELGAEAFAEAKFLAVDSTKARRELGWLPRFSFEATLRETFDWYQAYYDRNEVKTRAQIQRYLER